MNMKSIVLEHKNDYENKKDFQLAVMKGKVLLNAINTKVLYAIENETNKTKLKSELKSNLQIVDEYLKFTYLIFINESQDSNKPLLTLVMKYIAIKEFIESHLL